MAAVVALDQLLDARRVWRGQPAAPPALEPQPTGLAALDAVLPTAGWPDNAISEVLIPHDGVGELSLLWPTLARLTQQGGIVALIAPPYRAHAPAWHRAGLDLRQLHIVDAASSDLLWAAEQCLRSGACRAVLCWPMQADDRALRRLQVAAESGQCLGIVFRPAKAALNPSPAALRLAIEARPRQLRVLKCRGGIAPAQAIPLPVFAN